MGIFIAKRLLQLIPVIFGILTLTFILLHLDVANPCGAITGHTTDPEALANCEKYLGVNLPLYQQYFRYLVGFFSGNWGTTPQGEPVLPQIMTALPVTIELVFFAMFLMIIIGIPLGVVAARHSGRWPDHLVRVFYLSGWATPTFLAGFLLIIFVAPVLNLPTVPVDATSVTLSELFLPALALAFVSLGIATRMTRTSMLEVLPMDYVKTARMKGLPENRVVYRHALRNSLITTTTVLGITAGTLLGGTVVVESIFLIPGIGLYAYNSILNYNYAGVIATAVIFAIGVVIANLCADIIYGVLDPRVEWR